MTTLNLGILGLGRIAKVHIQNIRQHLPQFKLIKAADPQLDEVWLSNHEGIQGTQDPSDVFTDPNIDAVLICSPVETHVPFILQAAQAGKSIFCEKPLSLNTDEVHQAKAATEGKVTLQIGFNRRFDPNFSKLQQAIQAQELGQPYMVRITSRDPGLPSMDYLKSSGGIFADMTIHDFDMARFLVGSEVEEIYATGGAWVDHRVAELGDIDTAVINLKFTNGVLGVIENCRHASYGYDQRCEVLAEKGQLSVDNCRETSVVHRTHTGQTLDPPLAFFLERYQQAFVHELEAFHVSVTQGTPPKVGLEDACQALRLSQAALQSMQQKKPIRLDALTGTLT